MFFRFYNNLIINIDCIVSIREVSKDTHFSHEVILLNGSRELITKEQFNKILESVEVV